MLISAAPFLSMANRLLRRGQTVALAADSIDVLQSEEIEDVTPPVFLRDELALATAAVPGHTPLSEELERATARQVRHAPVIRYTLKNCLVHPYGFDYSRGSHRISRVGSYGYLRIRPERLDAALYVNNAVIKDYFGHWLRDGCSTALLASAGEPLLFDVPSAWPHASAYARVFGLAPEPPAVRQVARLHLFQDYGQGSMKRARYAEMRARAARFFGEDALPPARVYLRRGMTGVARPVVNEPALIEVLSREGFEIFDIANEGLEALWRRLRNAQLVVSVDGSHLNHLYMAMRPGTGLLMIVPGSRFTLTHVGLSRAFGMHFGFHVMASGAGGAIADIPAVLRLVERLEAVI